jgi:glutaredoxin
LEARTVAEVSVNGGDPPAGELRDRVHRGPSDAQRRVRDLHRLLLADLPPDPRGVFPTEDAARAIAATEAAVSERYPGLTPLERVARLHTDLTAAQRRMIELREAAFNATSEHHRVIEPYWLEARRRADALRPLLLAYRTVRQDWREAEADAVAAEKSLALAEQRRPEPVDGQFLKSVLSGVRSLEDPTARQAMTRQLARYRTMAEDNAAAAVAMDVATARTLATGARGYADMLKAETEAAKRVLDDAAGPAGVVDESDVQFLRMLPDELAFGNLRDAQSDVHRLGVYLKHSRSVAAAEIRDATSASWRDAFADVSRRTGTPPTDIQVPQSPIPAVDHMFKPFSRRVADAAAARDAELEDDEPSDGELLAEARQSARELAVHLTHAEDQTARELPRATGLSRPAALRKIRGRHPPAATGDHTPEIGAREGSSQMTPAVAGSAPTTITVYIEPGQARAQCEATVRTLDMLGFEYRVLDISTNAAARERLITLGHNSAPVVEAGEVVISGFRPDRLKTLPGTLRAETGAERQTSARQAGLDESAASDQVDVRAVEAWAGPYLRSASRRGTIPQLGSPEWVALPNGDPRKTGAVVAAALQSIRTPEATAGQHVDQHQAARESEAIAQQRPTVDAPRPTFAERQRARLGDDQAVRAAGGPLTPGAGTPGTPSQPQLPAALHGDRHTPQHAAGRTH